MVDPTTVNRGLAVPTRGSDVGVWDTPVNGNMTLLDTMLGATTSISVTSGTTVLNAAQYQCGTIFVSGTLTGPVNIQFPNAEGWWSVLNFCANAHGLAAAVFASSAGGGQIIGLPPGEQTDIQVRGASGVFYRNLGRVGSYMDLAQTAVPLWISGGTTPPYLNCNGGSFSSGTYPILAGILGGTTLPDARGRARFYIDGGTNRITTGGSGINGNSMLAGGGGQNTQLEIANLPTFAPSGEVSAPGITVNDNKFGITNVTPGGGTNVLTPGGNTLGITAAASAPIFTGNAIGSSTAFSRMPPTVISGLCLIRAA